MRDAAEHLPGPSILAIPVRKLSAGARRVILDVARHTTTWTMVRGGTVPANATGSHQP